MNMKTNKAVLSIAMVLVLLFAGSVMVGSSDDIDATDTFSVVKVKVGGSFIQESNQDRTFDSIDDAVRYINTNLNVTDESDGIVIWCEGGKAVKFTSVSVLKSMTIEGNGAYCVGANPRFAIEIAESDVFTHDVSLTINNLNNGAVWGTRYTDYTFTLEMNNCSSEVGDDAIGEEMRVYLNNPPNNPGFHGVNNITLNGCKFYENSSNCTVYSNANGTINVNDCIFDGVSEPININSKSANVDVKINVNRCSFNNSGIAKTDGADKTWAAPIRVVNSTDANGSSIVSVDSCEFTYGEGKAPDNGDVLIGDGRSGQGSNDVKLTVRNTTADVQFQEPGYYTNDPSNPTDGSKIQSSVVRADQILESTGSDVTISDAPVDVPDTPDYDDEDDDDYPFIPGNNTPQTSTNSNDDKTTLVASAAAVVVIMLAVVALMATRNN